MKKLCLAFAALTLAPGCATILTPQRCQQAAAGLSTVDQIAQVFINNGIEAEKARKLAQAVLVGQIALAAACAAAPTS